MIGAQFARNLLAGLGRLTVTAPEVGDLNFVFAAPSLGGSERVHADIVASVADRQPTVFFTERGRDEALLPAFRASARVTDLAPRIASRVGFYTLLGSVAAAINSRKAPVVIGSYSFFFIRLVGRLAPHVRCLDIVHNFGTLYERGSLEAAPRLNERIAVNFQTLADLRALYDEQGLPLELGQRVQVIENCCDVPERCPDKNDSELRVLFVARGAPEKRAHLAGRAASQCKAAGLNTRFTFVGELESWVDEADRSACEFLGKVTDPKRLTNLYAQSHALLLTSEREGFPLVIMEAMAQGCVPLATNVGGIRFGVQDNTNALLFEPGDESRLVSELVATLAALAQDRARLMRLSRNAFDAATLRFSRALFTQAYRALLLGESWPPGYPQFNPPAEMISRAAAASQAAHV
jgi:glycosyltransferase involved in cell wall biosynthesis